MSPKEKKLVEWVKRRKYVTETQIIGSSLYDQAQRLVKEGVLKWIDDPSVKDRSGYPVRSLAEAE